ncbi:MAG: pyruvate formate-lyase [Chloroflexi bacterium]|nr:pyruvate formate-lyase [Chloroflexota bacterium]
MNERIMNLKRSIRAGEHKQYRQSSPPDVLSECEAANLSWMQRSARLTCRMCQAEQPVIGLDDQIVFTRTVPLVPPIYSAEAWAELFADHIPHELGPISNICANWGLVLADGLSKRKEMAIDSRGRHAQDAQAVEFLDCAIETIDAVLELAGRYAAAARAMGRTDLAEILEHVPAQAPRSFHEALQALRLNHAVVWMSGNYHVGLGRLDQYLWPYLEADLASGRLDVPSAEELLAEFFISLNRDSDLYPGVQQGDNGQTLSLGGVKRDGSPAVNPLTGMVLRVSRDLELIDPKINLRISKETDLDLLSLATELTRAGLGFPQYSNDDVVIPALAAHGYALEDARDYTVAACWEFIIPGKGMEIVNIGAVSFPAAADVAIRQALSAGQGLEDILNYLAVEIRQQVKALADSYSRLRLAPAPYYSVLMDGCLEAGADLSAGLKYNNFGIHGAGSANAADALAAVRRFVFEEKSVSPEILLAALDADFSGQDELRLKLSSEAPKIGNNDDAVDHFLDTLFDDLAQACEQYGRTPRGGILRPGTGSAMYYIWLATGHEGMHEPVVGATADGRRKGSSFSANLAPAPGAQVAGPISVLQSFSKIDYQRICNGGPITMELSESLFRNAESIRQVAMLVRIFAQLGCQQLQLNSLSVATLLDAKAHPEQHKNLIVRVWGWSGYFCELAPEYQDHIIARHRYQLH